MLWRVLKFWLSLGCLLLVGAGGAFGAGDGMGALNLSPHRGEPEFNDSAGSDQISTEGASGGWVSGVLSWIGMGGTSKDYAGVGTVARKTPLRARKVRKRDAAKDRPKKAPVKPAPKKASEPPAIAKAMPSQDVVADASPATEVAPDAAPAVEVAAPPAKAVPVTPVVPSAPKSVAAAQPDAVPIPASRVVEKAVPVKEVMAEAAPLTEISPTAAPAMDVSPEVLPSLAPKKASAPPAVAETSPAKDLIADASPAIEVAPNAAPAMEIAGKAMPEKSALESPAGESVSEAAAVAEPLPSVKKPAVDTKDAAPDPVLAGATPGLGLSSARTAPVVIGETAPRLPSQDPAGLDLAGARLLAPKIGTRTPLISELMAAANAKANEGDPSTGEGAADQAKAEPSSDGVDKPAVAAAKAEKSDKAQPADQIGGKPGVPVAAAADAIKPADIPSPAPTPEPAPTAIAETSPEKTASPDAPKLAAVSEDAFEVSQTPYELPQEEEVEEEAKDKAKEKTADKNKGKDKNDKDDKENIYVEKLPAYKTALCVEPVVYKPDPVKPKDEITADAAADDGGWFPSLFGIFGGGDDAPPEDTDAKDEGGEKDGEAVAEAKEESSDDAGDDENKVKIDPNLAPPVWPENAAVACAKQPFMQVRTLMAIQDRIAQGDRKAQTERRDFMREMSQGFRLLPDETWADTRNVRAVVFYVLAGGNPRILRRISGRQLPSGLSQRLVRGTFAYGEGRLADARALLMSVPAREFGPMLSGPLSLIQASLIMNKQPDRASELFTHARLYATGTMVEEVALRHGILLAGKLGYFKRFDRLTSQFFRRFGKSLYQRQIRRKVVTEIVNKRFAGDEARWRERLVREIDRAPLVERAALYLWAAAETTRRGEIKLAQLAAEQAAKLYPAGTHERNRADLYRGAVLVATADVDKGLALLDTVKSRRLGRSDRELYAAATGVGAEILKPPTFEPERLRNVSGPAPESVSRAADLLSSVDDLLGDIE